MVNIMINCDHFNSGAAWRQAMSLQLQIVIIHSKLHVLLDSLTLPHNFKHLYSYFCHAIHSAS